MEPIKFLDSNDLQNYYDSRYASGYMDEWDSMKVEFIEEILRTNVKKGGLNIIDFGCGSGFFTRLLNRIFVDGKIHGADISENAISIANSKGESIRYHVLNDKFINDNNGRFNLIFTHHVLEHVDNLLKTCRDISTLSSNNATIVHILPCANPGSFEYWVCSLYDNGIDKDRGNRFFCEDPGHLRRLSSHELITIMNNLGFYLKSQYFLNQFFGAIKYITESSPNFINEFLDYRKAKSHKVVIYLANKLANLIFLLRYSLKKKPFSILRELVNKKEKSDGYILMYIKILISIIILPMSFIIEKTITYFARMEWNKKRHLENGSEMILIFKKNE